MSTTTGEEPTTTTMNTNTQHPSPGLEVPNVDTNASNHDHDHDPNTTNTPNTPNTTTLNKKNHHHYDHHHRHDDALPPPSDLYSVRVKSTYVLLEPPTSLPSAQAQAAAAAKVAMDTDATTATVVTAAAAAVTTLPPPENSKKRKNRRANRRPRDVKLPPTLKMCRFVVQGEPCPYQSDDDDDAIDANNNDSNTDAIDIHSNNGNKKVTKQKCTYIHDIQYYLHSIRPPDIQMLPPPIESGNDNVLPSPPATATATATTASSVHCPIYDVYGYCPYGIMCRFGTAHICMTTGANLRRTHVLEAPTTTAAAATTTVSDGVQGSGTEAVSSGGASVVLLSSQVKNILLPELQVQLRKNLYPFQCQRKQKTGHRPTTTTTTTNLPVAIPVHDDNNNTRDESIAGTSTTAVSVSSLHDTTTSTTTTTTGTGADPIETTNIHNISMIETAVPATATATTNSSYQPYPGTTHTRLRKLIDFSNKVYVAPLTTVGNLPFRRIMKQYGADITCGEMAIATNILEGKASEWALLKRHVSEDIFGIQLAAGYPDIFTRTMELIEQSYIETDFVDLNLGCPIDLICQKGAGAALMQREKRLQMSLAGIFSTLHKCPVTIKMRTGWDEKHPIAHELVNKIQHEWGYNPSNGLNAIMIHGRSRLQRYSREANWEYIGQIASQCCPSGIPPSENHDPLSSPDVSTNIPIIGNGDILSYVDYQEKVLQTPNVVPCAMLGRGALIKPWLPTEIKELRHYDISASERLDILRNFVHYGLEHWGSDQHGVNNCRRFLLEWLSFLHRYIPVGIIDHCNIPADQQILPPPPPQRLNQRPPKYVCGRNELETLFMSSNCYDWIKISEMLLGPVPDDFHFEPKHKANAY
jgi:tRNA-dihydrouridine synthase 3